MERRSTHNSLAPLPVRVSRAYAHVSITPERTQATCIGGLAIPAAFNKTRKAVVPKVKRSPKLDPEIDAFLNRVAELAKDSSINEFAASTKTNAETVRRYLRKISVPDVGFAIRLARRLGIRPDWLLTGKGAMKSNAKG